MDGMLQNVAPDIPAAEAKSLAATQGRLAGRAFGQSVTMAAWKMKPSWFVVTTDDRVVSPELQAAEAKRMGAKVTELQSSHMSLLSHPQEVAKVIEDAAAAVTAG
jgi:pimeloyl-ACP methyl ester carboxylesterase